MKKLINDVSAVVPEMLTGLVALNPDLALLPGGRIVCRADAQHPEALARVALVSGGGSGHEPAHGGYVGRGMLSAAVAGEVFSSPSTDAVLDAIRAVAGPRGLLLIVKNYTGDRLNFGLAAETARSEGVDTEVVVVADDVALAADGPHAGRRGLAGTVFVHKVAGAAAAEGLPLAEVARVAREAAAAVRTMGVALGPCTVPAAGSPGFTLGDDEIEWGLGIHGEQGIRRTPMRSADDIVAGLLAPVIDDLGLTAGRRVAVLVNNLGGSAAGELSLVAGAALSYLRAQHIVVERAWAGTFLTALEMPGCSLSVLEVDDQRLARLDAPASTTAWPGHLGRLSDAAVEPATPAAARREPEVGHSGTGLGRHAPLRLVIEAVCEALIEAEPKLTELDQRVGDGDLGDSLARAARGIRDELDGYPPQTAPADVLRALSATVRRVVGGTSGPLYAVLLLRAATALDLEQPGATAWAAALSAGVAGVQDLGGARVGDRTMVDALHPASVALSRELKQGQGIGVALDAAVAAARTGTEQTADRTARLGRASYVGDRARGVPDPGAAAVTIWLAAVRDAVAAAPLG